MATVHVNQSKTSINVMTLSYTCVYICTHCVIACPLLHQHASTPLACTPCYCTRCRDPMYPCMPCWSVCNRLASPMRCLHPTSWDAHTGGRHTGVARPASTLCRRRTRAGKPLKVGFSASIYVTLGLDSGTTLRMNRVKLNPTATTAWGNNCACVQMRSGYWNGYNRKTTLFS